MPKSEIIEEIDRFREKLLELSNRNPLLNYRPSKLKTLPIVGELPNPIFSRLVGEGKKFRFAPKPEGEEDLEGAADSDEGGDAPWTPSDSLALTPPSSSDAAASERYGDDVLLTSLTEARLEAVLKNIRREANGAILETGVNYLYLAMGMLVWYEADSSERELRAPLLLIPVEITQYYDNRANRYQYAVEWREEEIQDNLCLMKRFEKDFGVRVPRFEDEQSPEEYFAQVEAAIRHNARWRVERQALVGFFSFQKLLMYLDIDPKNWVENGGMGEESILHKVVWGNSDGAAEPLYASDYDIDEHPGAHQVVFPLDADSSQHSALVDIQAGKSLVIEGPPGTGKSQTITNAIAASLHQGKSVLFVAEKLTALEVVREKLTKLGLGDFCLELHSDAASPRLVYESLRRRLEGQYLAPGELHEIQEELQRKKQQLSSYLAATAEIVGPYKEPLHNLLWRVTNLRAQGFTALPGAKVDSSVTKAILNENAERLESFAETLRELPEPNESPWWGCWLTKLNPNHFGWVKTAVTSMAQHAAEIDTLAAECAGELGPEVVAWIAKRLHSKEVTEAVQSVASAAVDLPEGKDLRPLLDKHNKQLATELQGLLQRYQAAVDELTPSLNGDFVGSLPAARSVVALLDGDFQKIAGDITWEELRAVSRLLGSLTARIRSGASAPASALDRAKVCRQLEHELGRDPLRSLPAIDAAGEAYLAGVEALADKYSGELADWYVKNAKRTSLPERLRVMAAGYPGLTTPPELQRLRGGEPRELAHRLAETVRSYRDRLRAVENRLFSNRGSCRSAAESVQRLIQQDLAPFPRGTRWDLVKASQARLKTLIGLLDETGRLAKSAEAQGLGSCRTITELDAALYLGKLVRHSIVASGAEPPARLFYKTAEATLVKGRESCAQIVQESQTLAGKFDLANLPALDELSELLQSFRMDGRGFFRFLKPGYRAAKRRLSAFSRGALPTSPAALILRLEQLVGWVRRRESFLKDEELNLTFGDRYAGVDTDWDQCKTLYQWAVTARGKGIDHSRASQLLELRDDSRFSLREFNSLLRSLVTELADGELIRLLGFDAAEGANVVPLNLLRDRAAALYHAITETVDATNAFTVKDQDTLEALTDFCESLLSLDRLEAEIGDASRWLELGAWYDGPNTDVEKLMAAVAWVSELQSLDLPPAVADALLQSAPAASLRELADSLQASQPAVDSWQVYQAAFAAISNWAQVYGPLLERALEGREAFRLDASGPLQPAKELADRVLWANDFRKAIEAAEKWRPLGTLYSGVQTSADKLGNSVAWASCLSRLSIPEQASRKLASGDSIALSAKLHDWFGRAQAAHHGWNTERQRFEAFGDVEAWWMKWRVPAPQEQPLQAEAQPLLEEMDKLAAWSAFCRIQEACCAAGLEYFVDAVLEGRVPAERVDGVYRFTVLEAIAEAKLSQSPALRAFSRVSMETTRRKFQELDRELLVVNQALVAHHASHQTPPVGVSTGKVGDYTELGLVRHEIQKQRRHCRIRDLLTRAGRAVQSLKPCFMMSPLSVSQYLDPEGIKFDLVVMDEASQVKPEDAIGVLLRAKQIVVVGDPKQLPPSSYFDKIGADVGDEEATQFDNTESILEVAMKAFQPVRRLRWHYRSLHESLIHFSNDRFYDGDLIVFPSPSTDAGLLGIRHHYVENATFNKGANQVEAHRVAMAIVEHAKARPEETLAVGAFNATQSGLIEDYLERLCMEDEEARGAVEVLNQHEKLIIKNLENLQGDERDVVFISYTYGPDALSGVVNNRFGPITGEAGWRRLNVLVSRARKRVEVFSSMKPIDIKIGPEKSRGVHAFRDYLEYSMSGRLPDRAVVTDRPMDSPFEEAVARVIQRMGLEVIPQVGVAGYFIDLGIRQTGEESFLLGVECDGATYHSSRSARDRDRLREEIIRSRGWDLHRIWSTDWYLNQKHEEERLERRLREAVSNKQQTL